MASMAKEPEAQNSTSSAGSTNGAQPKVQPVALEIAVTVNGARTVQGSDKREPFSESTQTVLVFGNGAVIRLTSNVTTGQLLFLTNEKTKKEVVCQVVKSKHYRSLSGYVELEFTEPAVGFWGMRFPTDRAAAPASNVTPISAAPAKPAPAATPAIVPPAKPVVPSAAIAITPTSAPSSPSASVNSAPVVAETVSAPVAPTADSASEELRKQTARLQEQLSSLAFEEKPKAAEETPTVDASSVHEVGAKILEFVKAEPLTQAPARVAAETSKGPASVEFQTPVPQQRPLSSLDQEVKIPSWLEPLARNAAMTPSGTTPVPASSTPAPVVTSQAEPSWVAFADAPVQPRADEGSESTPEPHESEGGAAFVPSAERNVPRFNSDLFQPTEDAAATASGGSKKGLWIGAVAATVLLAAGGGWWYMQQSGLASANTSSGASRAVEATPPYNSEMEHKYLASTSTPPSTQAFSTPTSVTAAQPVNVEKEKPAVSTATDVQKIPSTRETAKAPAAANSTAGKAAEPIKHAEPVEEPRKTSFSKLKLAAPKVTGGKSTEAISASEPGLAVETNNAAGAMSTGLESAHRGPAAPVPVGGEVKTVQLLSSVQPVYPQMARTQRISGDVKIDALIDENGRVTGMKVVSGPVLLHQAAMDALRQWKYRPAMLDGKPVAMHLVVTIQFRLQ